MTVTLHRSVIDTELDRAASRWADRIGRRIVTAAQNHCPVDEGRLRASIDYSVVDTGTRSKTVIVGSPLAYAPFVHDGTGIYGPTGQRIVPVSAKALKFRAGNARRQSKSSRGFVFAKSVAGSPAQPFLAQGMRDVLGTLPTFVTRSPL